VHVRRFLSVIAIVAVVAVVGGPSALAKKGDKPGSGDTSLDSPSSGGQAPRTEGYEKTLKLALQDIEDYWTDEFPKLYGKPYKRVSEIIAGKPGVRLPKCNSKDSGEYDEVQGNAFYCFGVNFVAYDDAELFPQLYHDFGAFSVALVLAHEWGHAIQDRAGNQQEETIYQELQADCFAGSWVKRVADGDSAIKLSKGNLDAALAAFLTFRDTPGGSPDDNSAHGAGFDRVSAFQQGVEEGAETCATYFDSHPVVVEFPFTSAEEAANGGNAPADEIIPDSVEMLNDFYTAVEPAYKPLTTDDIVSYDSTKPKSFPKCGDSTPDVKELKSQVFYCGDDNFIAFDEPYVEHVYDDIGDFGVTSLLASTWATYVQSIQHFPGVDSNSSNAVLGADCYTGGFAAALYQEKLLVDPETGAAKFTLSPGDLDETLQAFIDYAAARGVGKDLDITFVRLEAFRNGFLNGYQACAQAYSSDTADTSLDAPSG
jgi:predicted metalloprotease